MSTISTISKDQMLAEFDRSTHAMWERVYSRIDEMLPPTFGAIDAPKSAVEADLIAHLLGARRALARWNPHPAVTQAEWPKFQLIIADIVTGAVNAVFDRLLHTMDQGGAGAGTHLTLFSGQRPVNREYEQVHVEDKPRFQGYWKDGKFYPPANTPAYRTAE